MKAQVLRLAAQDRALVDHVALAQGREALDHRVRAHLGAAADADAGLHDRVGADGDVLLQIALLSTRAVGWMATGD